MKLHYCFAMLLILGSCTSKNNNNEELEKLKQQLTQYEEKEQLEKETKIFIQKYLDDLEDSNWVELITQRHPDNPDHLAFVERHKKFRNTYHEYKTRILHSAFDGNEGIVWLEVSTRHGGKASNPKDILYGLEPTGKKVIWQEAWFYNMKNNQFGGKWSFLGGDLIKMKSVGINCVPDEYFN